MPTKKSELKIKKSNASVTEFVNSIKNPTRKRDAKTVLKIMKEVTGEKPKMWGSSIIGFGDYEYTRSDKKTFNWMMTGFSPRSANTTIYIMPGYKFPEFESLLKKLGPYKTGKSCLYITDLEKVHLPTLKKIITVGYKDMMKRYKKK